MKFWIVYTAIFLFLNCGFFGIRRHKHAWRYKAAKRLSKKINDGQFPNPQYLFSYLRKIDPFVFEELLLISFKNKGFRVKRNRRYTGDGGIDGKVKVDGCWCLIQAKRYSGPIKKEHVEDFSRLCIKKKTHGYFIHTGSTSGNLSRHSSAIDIISGSDLIGLLNSQRIEKTRPKVIYTDDVSDYDFILQ